MVPACHRCRSLLDVFEAKGDNSTSAVIAISALLLFLPAVTLPFLRVEQLGHVSEQSLLGAARALFESGAWFVGTVVLVFSVILPPAKLIALLMLSFVPQWLGRPRRALGIYKAVEAIGRWGMLDVLLVAVLVAFVKLGDYLSFAALPGLFVFGGFVLLSLIASFSFNPQFLWSERTMPAAGTTSNATNSSSDALNELPEADVRRRRRWRWLWLLPVAAMIAVALAVYYSWSEQGTLVHVTFPDGQGLKAGDALRYNGIVVGQVEEVTLSDDLETIDVAVRLKPESESLAREGTRFWIVHPEVQLSGVTGLETIVGAKYLSVLPGQVDGSRKTRFVGLNEAPLIDALEKGGIEIVLQAETASGLRRGSPIYYRRLRVGGIKSVALASDGSAVEAVAYIRPQFRSLIREETHFWNAGGVRVEGGLTGFSLHVGSVETLLTAGVAMGVPPEAGEQVERGTRFILHEQPEDEWLTWKPTLSGGTLPEELPEPQQAVLEYMYDGNLWDTEERETGWVLRTAEGLLGPKNLMQSPTTAVPDSAQLLLSGDSYDLPEEVTFVGEDIALWKELAVEDSLSPARLRAAATPEDVLIAFDPAEPPSFISAARLEPGDSVWAVSEELPISAGMHGAPAVAVSDGAVIGVLLVEGGTARISALHDVDSLSESEDNQPDEEVATAN
mgnify:FL=1